MRRDLVMGLGQFIGAFADAAAPAPIVVAPPSWQRRLRRWALRKAGRMVARAMRRVWRWGRMLAPWYVAMVVWVAAALMGLAEQGWRTVAITAAAGLPALYWWLGAPLAGLTRRRGLKPLEHRVWYAAFYALLSVWASVGAATTVLPPWAGVLWVSTFAVWVRWVWHHRVRPAEPLPGLGERDATWLTVKGMGGTTLANVVDLGGPRRWEADVDLGDTELLVKDVTAAAPYIAKRFKVPSGNVVVDYAPSRIEHVAKLTVVEDNPLFEPIVYDESWMPTEQDVADGCVPFHLYPNGMRGRARLWLPGAGTVNSLFTGDIRTGKSAGMEAKMIQACWTSKVWPMAADPQGGVSMPTWCSPQGRGLAKWQATDIEAIFRQLSGWRDAVYARSRMMADFRWVDKWGDEQVGINCWDPSIPGMPPAVGWTCDEFWMVMLHDEFYEIFKECFKIQNKTGMFMDIATQYPGIEEFHNDMALRQPLTAGNMWSYRNTASSVKEMILPSGTPSPQNIPWETPEGAHTKGTMIAVSQAPRSSLPVYSRSVWAERSRYWAAKAVQRVPELDAVTMGAFAKWMDPAAPVAEPQRERIVVAAPAQLRVKDRILAFLRGRDEQRAHTGVIAEQLELPKGTAGTTLKRMEADGLVRQLRRGVWSLEVAEVEEREPVAVA
jgi:hypothetical protein